MVPASNTALAEANERIHLTGIIYLSTEIPPNTAPEDVLQPYLSAIQYLNRPSIGPSPVLTSIFYSQLMPLLRPPLGNSKPELETQSPSTWHTSGTPPSFNGLVPLYAPTHHLAEFGDEASEEAERVFWAVMKAMGLDGRSGGVIGDRAAVEEGVKRVGANAVERRPSEIADSAEGGKEDVERVTVMWPKAVIDESVDDGW